MTRVAITVPAELGEGTRLKLCKWLKSPGDAVAMDEPLVVIETDKVATEVSATADGIVEKCLMPAGSLVEAGMVIGSLQTGGAVMAVSGGGAPIRSSPGVRRLVAQHGLDLRAIKASGSDGRISRADIADHLSGISLPLEGSQRATDLIPKGRRIPHSTMRLAIANNMQRSVASAPQATGIMEADFSAVLSDLERRKPESARSGVKLTATAYLIAACARVLPRFPAVNSRWHGDALEIFDDINIGVAVSLGDDGLIVPVIRNADTLSLLETARVLCDLTQRARNKALRPADLRDGTFTVSNHGVFGSLAAAPVVLWESQSAALGVGKIEKRPVVREVKGQDLIVIRPMAYVSLTIDHRALDGHQANAFLGAWVGAIEQNLG